MVGDEVIEMIKGHEEQVVRSGNLESNGSVEVEDAVMLIWV